MSALAEISADESYEAQQFEYKQALVDEYGVSIDLLEGWEILELRDDKAATVRIPIDKIDRADMPLDPDDVEDVIEELDKRQEEHGGTGQRDAGVVFHVPDKDQFYLIDGFHRAEAQVIRSKRDGDDSYLYLLATVEFNKTYEDVVDERIAYTRKKHDGILFVRAVFGMQSVWSETEWAEQIPSFLTALRTHDEEFDPGNRTLEGKQLSALDPDTHNAIYDWIAEHCKKWKFTPDEIREKLAATYDLAEDLFAKIHEGRGVPPAGKLSKKAADFIAAEFVGDHELQRAIAKYAIKHKMSGARVKRFVEALEEDEVLYTADEVELRSTEELIEGTKQTRRTNSPNNPPKSAAKLFESDAVVETTLDRVIEVIESIAKDPFAEKLDQEAIDRIQEAAGSLAVSATSLQQVLDRKAQRAEKTRSYIQELEETYVEVAVAPEDVEDKLIEFIREGGESLEEDKETIPQLSQRDIATIHSSIRKVKAELGDDLSDEQQARTAYLQVQARKLRRQRF